MANTHIAHKTLHMALAKYISSQAFAFALVQFAVSFGNNTRCILTAMLQHGQRIVEP
jgi:hypothetical protein